MDSQNPFQAPAAELLANQAPAQSPRLYSVAAIGLGTFVGTSVAGAYFITQNLKALGREREINKVWAMGIGIFIAMTLAGFLLPDSVPGIVFILPPIFAMNTYARQLLGPQLQIHEHFFSLWRAVGIGLLFSLVVVVALIAVVMLSGFE
ncbi:hypothetical protein BK634_22785 [Pseudomonas chlororaphis]|jgi:hypothetical protein|uniref:Permease n=1 Tax=Pseudomonas morbosilactucae TaxID=2938197 RepID=A0ABT0JFH3_9PSED|nr:hypothetical protein [Pseudomonas morbosilactucae]MCK9814667.1 hypothetical protein [Pseudomonas morbosilactucae]ROL67201.1 hypothetical protein BK634_22785 [Pseudomonas chlororaphis]